SNVRFEDSGSTLVYLEDEVGDINSDTRSEAIRNLASEYSVTFDEENNQFYTQWFEHSKSSHGIINFISFMNRIQDIALLSRDKVENAFKEDLFEAIQEKFQGEA